MKRIGAFGKTVIWQSNRDMNVMSAPGSVTDRKWKWQVDTVRRRYKS